MRTLVAVLLAAGVAAAYLPPPPCFEQTGRLRSYDVCALVGDDGPFRTAEELQTVIRATVTPTEWGTTTDRAQIEYDARHFRLLVSGSDDTHSGVKKLLTSLHNVQERRKLQVTVECLVFTTSKGTGGSMLLPKEGDTPVSLTGKEVALMTVALRALKAEGSVDVRSRPTLTVMHGQNGSFQVGQQVPEAVVTSVNPGGTLTRNVKNVEAGLSLKLTPTVQDGGGVKLAGTVMQSEVVKDEKVRVTHQGEFKVESLPAGGTAVARIPGVGGTDTEMYLMVTVASVAPAKKAEPKTADAKPAHAYDVLPPVELPPTPKTATRGSFGTAVPLNGQPYHLPLSLAPAAGWQQAPRPEMSVRFVLEDGTVFTPTGEIGTPSVRFATLTRSPILGKPWNEKPTPKTQQNFFGLPSFGIEWEY